MRHQVIEDLLSALYKAPVLQGKGGFWIKGHGFITLQKARKLTNTPGPKREPGKIMLPWGDYATIVALNGSKLK